MRIQWFVAAVCVSLALVGCPEDDEGGNEAGTGGSAGMSAGTGSEAGTMAEAGSGSEAGTSSKAGTGGEAGTTSNAGTGSEAGTGSTGAPTCASLCAKIQSACECSDECEKCQEECEDDAATADEMGLGTEWDAMLDCCDAAELSEYCDEDGFDPCQKGACTRPF